MTETTALAERMNAAAAAQQEGRSTTLLEQLESPEFKRALGRVKAIDPERYIRLSLTEIRKNPKLLRCTPQSFLGAVMTGAQLGLEPDVRGLAYLIPRWNGKTRTNDCTFMVGYRGYLDLARRSGVDVSAEVVYEHDEFDFRYGTDAYLHHKPLLVGDRGAPIAAYAVAGKQFMVLAKPEIEKRRGRAQAGDKGPWTTDWDAMARKTAVRALAAYLPQSVELARAALVDEQVRVDLDTPIDEMQYPQQDEHDESIEDADVVDESESGDADDREAPEPEVEGEAVAPSPGVTTSPDSASVDGPDLLPPGGSEPVDYSTWTRADLVSECDDRGLATSGNMEVLIRRLTEHDAAMQAPFE